MRSIFLSVLFPIAACGSVSNTQDAPIDSDRLLDAPPRFLSCAGLAGVCGTSGFENCCETQTIPGGTYYRGYDLAPDSTYKDMSYPATISTFQLDKYEVTVSRFRAFINAGLGTRTTPPLPGAGAHAHLANSGWDVTWGAQLQADTNALIAALTCDATHATWTMTAGANEGLPINCVTWYEASAFCAWDGGYLPTETEWEYAAGGGLEQRSFPWSSPAGSLAIDCSYANYNCGVPDSFATRVGSKSPKGDGRWGNTDLGGNIAEWNLDLFTQSYGIPCNDCAPLGDAAADHVTHDGSFSINSSFTGFFRVGSRLHSPPNTRNLNIGFRCARGVP